MNKKMYLLFISTLLFSFLVLNACTEDEIAAFFAEKSCSLATSPTPVTETSTVTYIASKTGDGVFTTITYNDENGEQQTVSTPKLPWSISATLEAPNVALIVATGVTTSGGLKIEYTGSGEKSNFSSKDECSQSN